MRKFGVDKPEMMSFTLGESEKVYKIPLAASLPALMLEKMQNAYNKNEAVAFSFQLDLLREYMGEEAVEKLTAGDVRDIFNAWTEESADVGVDVGE